MGARFSPFSWLELSTIVPFGFFSIDGTHKGIDESNLSGIMNPQFGLKFQLSTGFSLYVDGYLPSGNDMGQDNFAVDFGLQHSNIFTSVIGAKYIGYMLGDAWNNQYLHFGTEVDVLFSNFTIYAALNIIKGEEASVSNCYGGTCSSDDVGGNNGVIFDIGAKFKLSDNVFFLNCGDYMKDNTVLAKTAKFIAGHKADLYYGDLYRRKLDSTDVAPDKITDFVCYRNVPCHQVCFYARSLFATRGYKLRYKVRADYEHFLWCIYEAKARCEHLPFTVADYEGDGFSENEANRKVSAMEHREITKKYLGLKRYIYKFIMILTLQPLRKKMADSPKLSATYHKIKSVLYSNPVHRKDEKGNDK